MNSLGDNRFLLLNEHTFFIYDEKLNKIEKVLEMPGDNIYGGIAIYGQISYGYLYGYICSGIPDRDEINIFINYKGRRYNVKSKNKDFSTMISPNNFYCTDNIIFFYVDNDKLVSIELNDDGNYLVRGIEETKILLEKKGDLLGFYSFNGGMHFGDHSGRYAEGLLWWKIFNNTLNFKNENYKEYKKMNEIKYSYLGYDNKGLQYFRKLETSNGINKIKKTGQKIKFNIAVFDTWTGSVFFYEDYNENEWNPPRDNEGKIICGTSWAVSDNGYIYFTDCDVKNKQWLVKKITNRWYEEIGIKKRHIGFIKENYIPLFVEPSVDPSIDGYNYENDIVWEKETKGKWSKIQKLDGREGWVESKYINFN